MCGAAPIGLELTELACKRFNIKYVVEGKLCPWACFNVA